MGSPWTLRPITPSQADHHFGSESGDRQYTILSESSEAGDALQYLGRQTRSGTYSNTMKSKSRDLMQELRIVHRLILD